MSQRYDLYVRDLDSSRDVYLGSQDEEPPAVIELATQSINFDGEQVFLRRQRYRRVSCTNYKYVYEQDMR